MSGSRLEDTDEERSDRDPFLSEPFLSGEADGEGGRSGLSKSSGGENDFFWKCPQQNADGYADSYKAYYLIYAT